MTPTPDRLERALERAVSELTQHGCPPRLRDALRDAVFPAGNRLRPRLCYAVAEALGNDRPELSDAAAVALELLHCASLVQDDLPAMDDAAERRGRPALHQAFGEATAILAADALIIGRDRPRAVPPCQDGSVVRVSHRSRRDCGGTRPRSLARSGNLAG
jgi:geranylgeranyl diphosphate synthase type II